jgi:hypothetical protein
MESWRYVWREGFATLISMEGLKALHKALLVDDPHLMQGATTAPPPLMAVANWPCEGGCLISYVGWQGERLQTVGDVEEYFAQKCFEVDQKLGEPSACRWLLNWFDDTPRDEVRRELIEEVEREIVRRQTEDTCPDLQIPLTIEVPELPEYRMAGGEG